MHCIKPVIAQGQGHPTRPEALTHPLEKLYLYTPRTQSHPHTHSPHPTLPPLAQSVTRVVETTFAAAGFSLAISGALTTWVKATVQSVTISQGPLATGTNNTYSDQSAQLTAGASMLLIGFIIGVFHVLINVLQARGFPALYRASLPMALFAFVCTLIGTIVSGAVSRSACARNF